jgi:AcrR family transcriptional regulator
VKPPDLYLRRLAERGYREEDAPRFIAAWERVEAAYFARIAAVTAPFKDWCGRFRAAATETVRLVEAHPAEARFFVVDALVAGELGRQRQQAVAARLAELLDSARVELEDSESVLEGTAGWIVAIFFSRVYRFCVNGGGPSLSSQLPELKFLAISAYLGPEAGLRELISSA